MIEKGSKSIAKEAYLIEQIQGRNVIHAAQTTLESLELFIFSSLSYAKKLSRGQYGHIYHFDGKAEAVESLQVTSPELARKTAVLQLGMFATNFREPLPLRPTKVCII
ncbi:hypothetical protein A1O3_06757 [Capronia epimyces CBS 606.96]|uniref:Uncharacterized protein n=1 Tax=Capronia epimyces CBS 606.96 TaxID=1182542 RepID=W9Y003_9EURO|nr:uncharacterized protein A1O3_06757 [Capronia epimyces CBS 606.96]EXJ82940.1 hypothetical protein A1O3_06757 [Capronia epimyces CBS 606.96]